MFVFFDVADCFGLCQCVVGTCASALPCLPVAVSLPSAPFGGLGCGLMGFSGCCRSASAFSCVRSCLLSIVFCFFLLAFDPAGYAVSLGLAVSVSLPVSVFFSLSVFQPVRLPV